MIIILPVVENRFDNLRSFVGFGRERKKKIIPTNCIRNSRSNNQQTLHFYFHQSSFSRFSSLHLLSKSDIRKKQQILFVFSIEIDKNKRRRRRERTPSVFLSSMNYLHIKRLIFFFIVFFKYSNFFFFPVRMEKFNRIGVFNRHKENLSI